MNDQSDNSTTVIGKLAARLARADFPSGDHASLRRTSLTSPSPQAVIVAQRMLQAAGVHAYQEEEFRRWLLLLQCLALVRGAHNRRVAAGAGLAQALYSEARLNRLLSADYRTLADILPRLARLLAAKQVSLNWQQLANLVLRVEREGYEDSTEKTKLEIARSFARETDPRGTQRPDSATTNKGD